MKRVAGVLLEGAEIKMGAVGLGVAVRCLDRHDRVNGGAPLLLRELRDRLEAFAEAESGESTSCTSVSGRETGIPDTGVFMPPSALTVRDAAGLMDISPQAVRAMCRSGALAAALTAAGRWEIDADSAAALAARRKEAER